MCFHVKSNFEQEKEINSYSTSLYFYGTFDNSDFLKNYWKQFSHEIDLVYFIWKIPLPT